MKKTFYGEKQKQRLEHIYSVSQLKGLGHDRGVVHFVYEVNDPAWGANLLFDIIFAENCTLLKKFATALQTFIHEEKFLSRYINLALHKATHQNSDHHWISVENTHWMQYTAYDLTNLNGLSEVSITNNEQW